MKRRNGIAHISEAAPAHVKAELGRHLLGRWLSKGVMEIRQHEIAAREVRRDPRVSLNPKPEALTKPGDPRVLRGIPAIGGRGSLGGAIAGTRPGEGRGLDAFIAAAGSSDDERVSDDDEEALPSL